MVMTLPLLCLAHNYTLPFSQCLHDTSYTSFCVKENPVSVIFKF